MDAQTAFIISIALNILGFILTAVGTFVMIKGIGADEYLGGEGLGALRFFTVQSNLLYGLYAGVFAVAELIYGSPDAVPGFMYILKYAFTVGVTITMLTVVFYLAPVVRGSYPPLFKGANLYFHLLVPLLGVISFCFFEKSAVITVPQVFLGLIPYGLYSVGYSINALTHIENGQVSEKYDWYRFLEKGVNKAAFAIIIMAVSSTAVCFGLWLLNSL